MTRYAAAFAATLGASILLAGSPGVRADQAPQAQVAAARSSVDIDREIWSVIVESVKNDDIAQMGGTYAPDAVLVTPQTTQAIRDTLAGWGRDMVTNKAKGTKATVAFRFSTRQDGDTTAFERGIFNYTLTDSAGVAKPGYYPFEQLLIKTGGHWRILMERQFAAVTVAEWNKLPKWPSP